MYTRIAFSNATFVMQCRCLYGLKARSKALAVYLRHGVPVPVVHGHVGEGQRHWHMPYALTAEPRPVKTLVVHSYIK